MNDLLFARCTTTRIPPETINATAEFLLETAIPRYRSARGFVQFLDLVDRQTGDAVAFTFWQTEAHLRAAAELAARIRAETGAMARADSPTVEQFEVIVRDQSSEPFGAGPAVARVLRAEAASGQFERTMEYIRSMVLPRIRAQQGFREFCLLSDASTGRLMTYTLYANLADLQAADATARSLAAQAAQDIAMQNAQIAYYEVAIRV